MRTIWKRYLDHNRLQEIEVPAGAKFLSAREQHGSACVWFECDTEAPLVKREIVLIGTGHSFVPEMGDYLGTCMLLQGHLVLHVFARRPE